MMEGSKQTVYPFFFHNGSFALIFDEPLSLNRLFGFKYCSISFFISIS